MIRILIAEDSPTQRLLLRAILESDPDLSVVGEARSGEEAIRQCLKLRPDLVTMDIHMPGIGGLEAIRTIMVECPCPILVITGIQSKELVEISFKALALGALTVLPKPGGGNDQAGQRLIRQVKTMAEVKVVRRTLSPPSRPVKPNGTASLPSRPLSWSGPAQVVVMGVSTGGPPALQAIFRNLPASFPLPVVVVQHISPGFIQGLAGFLSQSSRLPCRVLEKDEFLQPGVIYLAPDDRHVALRPARLAYLDGSPAVDGHRPSATVLFESAAHSYGPAAIGVLLTGMGSDGARGLLAMRRAGAYTLAQDEASSAVFGMPKAAIDLQAAVEVLDLERISRRLLTLLNTNLAKQV